MALKQRVVRALVRQFGHPHGIGGRLAGWVMAHRSSNRQRNRWVVSLLDVRPTDRVLEIGFGPGLAIAELSRRATRGTVYGIDHSEVMLHHATKRNADAILAVNSLGFWPEPTQRLVELRALLRPGGRIAIAAQPRCPGATKETSANAAREIETLLHEAGFSQTHVETLDLDPPVVCVIARRG